MDVRGQTALVTGGATGIGLAIATRLMAAGARVIVCGRREDRLREAAAANPGMITRVADVAREEDREALFAWATEAHPEVSIVVNNAGIQRRFRVDQPEPWAETRQEIAINFDGAVHLSLLFLPHLLKLERAAIVNVTSGLAFAPMATAPVYCATKAALHSFTLSLRHQLASSAVRVVEIIPPAVNTDLGGAGLHDFGAPLDDFADDVTRRMLAGELEVAYGFAEDRAKAAREAFDDAFARINGAPVRR